MSGLVENAVVKEELHDPRTLIAGRYAVDLDHPLGAGGMAIVYKGRDLRTRRDVALKTLRIEYRNDPGSRARFRHEARLMAFVNHPNLVRVFDLQEAEDASWVVMELIPGQTLKALLTARGTLPIADVAQLLNQLAAGLDHIHSLDLVHLDVKPQNVLVTADGTAKLIDFGLAQSSGSAQVLISGTTFGTAAYLAPEQVTGETVDAATDVYALGCVVYEALTGRSPFQTGDPGEVKRDVMLAHLEREPVPPSQARPELGLPVWIDDVLRWALAKKPSDRYRDLATFARLFHSGTLGRPTDERGATVPASPRVAQASISAHEQTTNVAAVVVPVAVPPRRQPRGNRSRAAYQIGGEVTRRARWLSRPLRRLAMVFLIGDLLLAVLLLAQGGPPGLIGQTAEVQPGVPARVAIDGLRLRDSPGTSSGIIASLNEGDRLRVLGQAELVAGERWWPARVEEGGGTLTGYVWQGGLIAVPWTGRLGWVQEVIDQGVDARERITALLRF